MAREYLLLSNTPAVIANTPAVAFLFGKRANTRANTAPCALGCSPTQLTELRRAALRRNERDSAQRAPARLTEPSRGALGRVAPPAAPALLPPLYYYPYQTGAAPTTRPASSRRVTSFRRGARARGGAGRARSRVTILTVSRRMLVERRERTSWGMRERARMNCLSVCLVGTFFSARDAPKAHSTPVPFAAVSDVA